MTRDFTYIDNIVAANILAVEASETRGQVINVACGEHVTLNEIIARINQKLGKEVNSNHVPP
ncbi:MAG: hypothetical protein IPK83_13585 [Planctomycetes bacterium]|nr:hypothetical protein [Planctomycetota bacterium]